MNGSIDFLAAANALASMTNNNTEGGGLIQRNTNRRVNTSQSTGKVEVAAFINWTVDTGDYVVAMDESTGETFHTIGSDQGFTLFKNSKIKNEVGDLLLKVLEEDGGVETHIDMEFRCSIGESNQNPGTEVCFVYWAFEVEDGRWIESPIASVIAPKSYSGKALKKSQQFIDYVKSFGGEIILEGVQTNIRANRSRTEGVSASGVKRSAVRVATQPKRVIQRVTRTN